MTDNDVPDDEDVAAAMRKYGGSFVSTLGELWLHGDPVNRGLIKLTWAAYWARYRAMAEIQKRDGS
jgi:hypothetical protein